MKDKKPKPIPILRAKFGRLVLLLLAVNSPLLYLLYGNRRSATAWAQFGAYWPVALAAVAGLMWTGRYGKRLVLRRTLVAGEPGCLRVTAPSTGISDPREQSLTGDLSDLTMTIKYLSSEHPKGRLARSMKRQQWSLVTFSGHAGTIKISPFLKSYKKGHEERFAEWKRTMANPMLISSHDSGQEQEFGL